MTAAFVVNGRILLNPEKIGHFHHAFLLHDLIVILRNLADSRFFAVDFYAGEIFSKAFFKPGIHSRGKHSVHKLVGIFVEDHAPGIIGRHVQHDEAAILPTLEQPCQLDRFPVPQGRELFQFLGITEGNNLQRYGEVHVRLRHQSREDGAHLLEAHGGFAPAFFTCIGDNREIWRFDFDPLSIAGGRNGNDALGEREKKQRAENPSPTRVHS
jgi:hypothetical protein